jgi:hypothetical protein
MKHRRHFKQTPSVALTIPKRALPRSCEEQNYSLTLVEVIRQRIGMRKM